MDYIYYTVYCLTTIRKGRTIEEGHKSAVLFLAWSLSYYIISLIFIGAILQIKVPKNILMIVILLLYALCFYSVNRYFTKGDKYREIIKHYAGRSNKKFTDAMIGLTFNLLGLSFFLGMAALRIHFR